jgi:transcriptional regulator with XRE-family HTH domain
MSPMDQHELADFLRHRRAELAPGDVGLTAGQRRRIQGLRREEVAQLVGMSVNYYTRLEQARGPQPSASMLAAIARALRLTHDEHDHLFFLAGHPAPTRSAGVPHVPPALARVMDRLDDTPALIISNLGETLLANRLAVALLGDHSAYTGFARSEAYRWFTELETRRIYPAEAHDARSRSLVAGLRAASGLAGEQSRAGDLVDALQSASPEFAALWSRHEVARRFEEHKTLLHPEVGALDLDCQVLFTEDQGQALLVLTAAPNSEAAQRLELLSILHATTSP